MKAYWGWILCAASCTVLALGFVMPRREPVPASKASADGPWDETARAEELDARMEAIAKRREARRAIAADVIAGRATLEQATERFLELNRLHPECMTALRLTNPGASDEQCVRRQVLEHVKSARCETSAETTTPTYPSTSRRPPCADIPAN